MMMIVIIIIIIISGIYLRAIQLLLHAAICYFVTRSDIASRSQIPERLSPNEFKHKTDTMSVVTSRFTQHMQYISSMS